MRTAWTAAIVAGLALSGCALRPQLARVAVDHNAMVAQTEDELTLLNIVRAKERFPMHFTTITSLRGNATLTAGAETGFSLPTGGGETAFDALGRVSSSKTTVGVETVTPKLSGSISTNPSFDVAVLNNEKFQRGIQQPLKPEVIEFILQQGWRDDLLMALLIERIDIIATEAGDGYEKGQVIATLNNANQRKEETYFGENASAAGWTAFLGRMRMVPRQTTKKAVDLVPVDALLANSGIADIAVLDGKGFDIGEANKVRVIRRPEVNGVTITFVDRVAPGGRANSEAEMTKVAVGAITYSLALEARDPEQKADHRSQDVQPIPAQLLTDGKKLDVSLRVLLRSVQGMMYFLGEYSRGKADIDRRYRLPNGQLLFDLNEERGLDGGAEVAIATRFRGKRYFIPDASGDGGVSLQVIDLLQQLLNLHKSADELPFTRSVTVVQ